ncbi:MAG: T9SS type A sorting domain-containing protein, partial [Bacteroidia bacterium]|nr:T9SS type A sorting domain-containing protein [Bacteroidia bacterium]
YNFEVYDSCENYAFTKVKYQREINILEECETAFGFNKELATCFIPDFSRWGWTNMVEEDNSYTLDLLAGAGQGNANAEDFFCDANKGTDVGDVIIDYFDGMITVTYILADDYEMTEAHVYIGCEMYPEGNNGPTVAPGQYTFVADESMVGDACIYTFGPFEASGPLYVIAHAVTCEVICECSKPDSCVGEYTGDGVIEVCPDEFAAPDAISGVDFKAYPVPFDNKVNIQYNFDYDTDVKIEIMDIKGIIIEDAHVPYTTKAAGQVEFDLSRAKDQMLFVRVKTNRGIEMKQIISSNNKR